MLRHIRLDRMLKINVCANTLPFNAYANVPILSVYNRLCTVDEPCLLQACSCLGRPLGDRNILLQQLPVKVWQMTLTPDLHLGHTGKGILPESLYPAIFPCQELLLATANNQCTRDGSCF